MKTEQTEKLHRGDIVNYNGKLCRISSIQVRGIAAPHFRLSDIDTGEGVEGGGLISHRLCSLPTDAEIAQAK